MTEEPETSPGNDFIFGFLSALVLSGVTVLRFEKFSAFCAAFFKTISNTGVAAFRKLINDEDIELRAEDSYCAWLDQKLRVVQGECFIGSCGGNRLDIFISEYEAEHYLAEIRMREEFIAFAREFIQIFTA